MIEYDEVCCCWLIACSCSCLNCVLPGVREGVLLSDDREP